MIKAVGAAAVAVRLAVRRYCYVHSLHHLRGDACLGDQRMQEYHTIIKYMGKLRASIFDFEDRSR